MESWRRKRTPRAQTVTGEPPADVSLQMRGLELVHRFEDAPEGEYHIAWSADGGLLAACAQDGTVAVWSEAAIHPRLLHGHSKNHNVFGLAWHPVRTTLATAGLDGTVRLWDLATGGSRVFCRIEQSLSGVAWSPDGSQLAVTDMDGGIGVWDSEKEVLLKHAKVHTGWVYRPCWSADGTALITGGNDGTNVLASNDLQRLQTLPGSGGNTHTDTALSPDGRFIASTSLVVRVWDLAADAEVAVLEGHRRGVGCVRFSPSGEFLASKSSHEVRLWRCRDWECVAIVSADVGTNIGGLDFHPVRPILAMKNEGNRTNDCFRIDYDLLRGAAVAPGQCHGV